MSVRSIAVFGLVLLSCCGLGHLAPPSRVALGADFTLRQGTTVSVGTDLGLTLSGVRNDSRCAVDVVCIWQGNAEVDVVAALPGAPPLTLTLNTGVEPMALPIAGYLLHLVALEPAPQSGVEIGQRDYVVTLRVDEQQR